MVGAAGEEVSLRLLEGGREDMGALQAVLESAPTFAERVTGAQPGATDAQRTYTTLPKRKSYDDKFVFGIFLNGEMVGCIDIIRGYPTENIASLGLMLIAEPHQRQGIGTAAYAELERIVEAWGSCNRIRLQVQMTNAEVIAFWRKVGFEGTGEERPWDYGPVHTQAVILEKSLRQ
jgi:uncharacterized protein